MSTNTAAGTDPIATIASGIGLVPRREVVAGPIDGWFPLAPGDRAFVSVGQAVVRGAPLAERLREPRTVVVAGPGANDPEVPGDRWTPPGTASSTGPAGEAGEVPAGELLFPAGGRWRVPARARPEPPHSPFPGLVRGGRDGTRLRPGPPAQGVPRAG